MSIDIDLPAEADDAGKYQKASWVEPTKPRTDLIPEARMNELKRLADITKHPIDALIAGWWLRFGEVQTLQVELDYARSIIAMHEKESPTHQSIEQQADQLYPEIENVGFNGENGYEQYLYAAMTRRKERAAYIAGASAHSVPESVKWINVKDGYPQEKGFYEVIGKNNQGNPTTPHDIWFSGTDWIVREGCKVIYWRSKSAESTPPQPTGDVKVLVDALQEADEYLSVEHFEKGKPVYRNVIAATSILHKKMKSALSSYQNSEPKGIEAIANELEKLMPEFENGATPYNGYRLCVSKLRELIKQKGGQL